MPPKVSLGALKAGIATVYELINELFENFFGYSIPYAENHVYPDQLSIKKVLQPRAWLLLKKQSDQGLHCLLF